MGLFSSDSNPREASGSASGQSQSGDVTPITLSAGDDVGNNEINILQQVTDQGAIQEAAALARVGLLESFDFGRDAVDLAADSVRAAERTSLSQQDYAAELFGGAQDTVELALQEARRSGETALDFGRDALFEVRDARSDALGIVESFAGEVVDDFAALSTISSEQALRAVQETARRESSNTDARVEGIANKALIGAGVLGGLTLVAFVFARRKR